MHEGLLQHLEVLLVFVDDSLHEGTINRGVPPDQQLGLDLLHVVPHILENILLKLLLKALDIFGQLHVDLDDNLKSVDLTVV